MEIKKTIEQDYVLNGQRFLRRLELSPIVLCATLAHILVLRLPPQNKSGPPQLSIIFNAERTNRKFII